MKQRERRGGRRMRGLATLTTIVTLALTGLAASSPAANSASAGTATTPLNSLTAAVPRLLSDTIPSVVGTATRLGPVAPDTPFTLIAPLTLEHQNQLDAYLKAEYTPGSPTYHQFLDPNGFARFFGASTAHVNAVTRVLSHLGFSVAPVTANHLYVEFTGPAALIERTFSTVIDRLRLPALNASLTQPLDNLFTANVTNLTLPASLSTLVSGLIGLNSLDVPHGSLEFPTKAALAKDVTLPKLPIVGVDGGATPCAAAVAGVGYTAPQLAEAYNFDGLYGQGFLGQGMTASLVEFSDYHDSNVATVQSCYGDTATKVNRILVDGGAGSTPGPAEAEDMADIGTMLEMLPKLAGLNVYVAPNTATSEYDLYNAFVTNDDSPVLSSSWGNCEENDSQSGARLFNEVMEEAAAQGQQVFEAAGDSGAVDCRGTPAPTGDSISVMTEAASPYATGVGGTDLGLRSTLGLGHDEDTWNDAGAGGGGQSSYWTMPTWQAALPSVLHAPGAAGTACAAASGTLCREVPDISADADPDLGMQGDTKLQFTDDVGSPGYSVYCGTSNCTLLSELGLPVTPPTPPSILNGLGGWQPIGGTSLATPLTASAALLWDQDAQAHGLTGLGFLNPSLYAVAADPTKYASDFYDITTDSNDAQYDSTDCPSGCNTSGLYQAATGYDMASGLGSYNAANLGADLVAQAAAQAVTPSALTVYGYTGGRPTTRPVVVSSGYAGSPYSVTSSASWLHASAGTIGHPLTWTASPRGLKAGTYSGIITITGKGGVSTLSVTYLMTPPAVLHVSPGALSFSESAVTTKGVATAATCNDSLWNDELAGEVGGTTPTRAQDAPSLNTLQITNSGPARSELHWAAFFSSDTSQWISQDLNPPGLTSPVEKPTQPIVSTGGALASGASTSIPLAAIANVNVLGGFPDLNQGTYHGVIIVADLADLEKVVFVPITLVLGNGSDTPTVVSTPSSLSVSVASGQTTTKNLVLSDSSKTCGYGFSLASDVPWAVVDSSATPGTVGTGGATTTVPIEIDASGLSPGTYHGVVTEQSMNAEPNPLKIAVTLTVT
jgi:hypothetical protein